MEATDIVDKEVERQAGFGYEPSWEDFVIAGLVEGRKEVVEWIEEKGFPHPVLPNVWQAKLREWGLQCQ